MQASNIQTDASISLLRNDFEWEPTEQRNKKETKAKTRQFTGCSILVYLSFSLIQDYQLDQLFPLVTISRDFPVEK